MNYHEAVPTMGDHLDEIDQLSHVFPGCSVVTQLRVSHIMLDIIEVKLQNGESPTNQCIRDVPR
jgi:hypothetical protein